MNVLFYVTGHGYGHASRASELIRRLIQELPGSRIYVRTSVPSWFFEQTLGHAAPVTIIPGVIDVGVVQKDALRLSKKKTLEAFHLFWRGRGELASSDALSFENRRIGLVISDIAPLAFLVARRLGVPSAAVTNFTWDWIYGSYVRSHPAYGFLIDELRDAYAGASIALRLPFAGDFSAFSHVVDIPLIARIPRLPPSRVRDMLRLPAGRPLVLVSFGGFPIDARLLSRPRLRRRYRFITTYPSMVRVPGVIHIEEEQLLSRNIAYPDLVNAVDAVVGKPGYGIVSECIACRTPFLFTSRGDFREYPVMVRAMKKMIPAEYISQRDLFSGSLQGPLEKLLSMALPPPVPCDGALHAAKLLASLLESGGETAPGRLGG
ncbi:MAG: hypothetical protein RDV48_10560 [Candidatus Eremiobacteraeota bacterium]|nr:hypothetical protein [Candidatus Eremiobacteraeota bacterium]